MLDRQMMIRRSLLVAAMLVLLAGVAGAQPLIEVPLSTPQYGPAPRNQVNPLVASDGTNFLVAWIDDRGPKSIYANRVTRTGEILDGTGIRVPTDPADAASTPGKLLGLFHIDGAYTLIYRTYAFSVPPPVPLTTQAVIISDDGKILDGPRQIFDHAVTLATSNGSRILIVDGSEVFLLTGRGEIIKQSHSAGFSGENNAAVASNGSTFLLVNYTINGASNTINLIAFDSGGQLTDLTQIGSGIQDVPIVQSDGADYLLLYLDIRLGQIADSVSPHAQILSTSMPALSQSVGFAALRWTGQKYLLASRTSKALMAVMALDHAGSPAGSLNSLETGVFDPLSAPAMAGNGSENLVAWTSGATAETNGYEIHAALVDAGGASHSAMLTVPLASNGQGHAAIATGGAYDLAVWAETSGIYATRVTSDGVALDGRGLLVYARTTSSSQSLGQNLRVVFDGAAYLVAWDDVSLLGQRIDPATGLLMGPALPLASCAGSFDLGYDGTSPVLFVARCSDQHVYAQRVGATGTSGPPIVISPADTLTSNPRAAWNGHEWLVAWTTLLPNPIILNEFRGNIYAARLSPALTVLDTQPIAIAASEFYEESPLVASDGHDFVVAWTRFFATGGLYLRHVHSDGTITDATFLPNTVGLSLVWDGLQYAVGSAGACTPQCQAMYLTRFDIRDDRPLLYNNVRIAELGPDGMSLAGSNGRVRIVYTRYALEPFYGGSARAFLRDDVSVPRRRAAGHR
jgi:hypothetical protein